MFVLIPFSLLLPFFFSFFFPFLLHNFCRFYWTNAWYADDARNANDVSWWSWSNDTWNANDATKVPVISTALDTNRNSKDVHTSSYIRNYTHYLLFLWWMFFFSRVGKFSILIIDFFKNFTIIICIRRS